MSNGFATDEARARECGRLSDAPLPRWVLDVFRKVVGDEVRAGLGPEKRRAAHEALQTLDDRPVRYRINRIDSLLWKLASLSDQEEESLGQSRGHLSLARRTFVLAASIGVSTELFAALLPVISRSELERGIAHLSDLPVGTVLLDDPGHEAMGGAQGVAST